MEKLQPKFLLCSIKTSSQQSGSMIGNLVPSLASRILYNLEHIQNIICTNSSKPIFYLLHFFQGKTHCMLQSKVTGLSLHPSTGPGREDSTLQAQRKAAIMTEQQSASVCWKIEILDRDSLTPQVCMTESAFSLGDLRRGNKIIGSGSGREQYENPGLCDFKAEGEWIRTYHTPFLGRMPHLLDSSCLLGCNPECGHGTWPLFLLSSHLAFPMMTPRYLNVHISYLLTPHVFWGPSLSLTWFRLDSWYQVDP